MIIAAIPQGDRLRDFNKLPQSRLSIFALNQHRCAQ
jgi:hypothetical protein